MYPRKLEGHGELMKMLQTIKKGSVILTLSTVLLGGTVSVKSLALEPESLQPYANQITSQEYSNNFEEQYDPNDYSENESEYEVSEPVAAAKPPIKTLKRLACLALYGLCVGPRKSPIEPTICTEAKLAATALGCKGVRNW